MTLASQPAKWPRWNGWAGSTWRAMFHTTAAASTAVPSENRTSGRRWNVQVVPASSTDHDVASDGASAPLSGRWRTRVS